MTQCDHIRVELAGYLAGELGGAERDALESHLEACEDCRGELAEVKSTVGALSGIPLEHRPPDHLEGDVFALVDLDDVAALARSAPLEHQPPLGLEQRALEYAGAPSAPPRLNGWQRAGLVAVPALAASVVALGFLGLRWRGDADQMHAKFGEAQPMATVQLVGFGEARTWPAISTELIRQFDGRYAVVLYLDDYPPSAPGEHFEVWQVAPDGRRMLLGSFVSEADNPPEWTVQSQLVYDPDDYPLLEVTIEEDAGDPGSPGRMVMQADLRD